MKRISTALLLLGILIFVRSSARAPRKLEEAAAVLLGYALNRIDQGDFIADANCFGIEQVLHSNAFPVAFQPFWCRFDRPVLTWSQEPWFQVAGHKVGSLLSKDLPDYSQVPRPEWKRVRGNGLIANVVSRQ